MNQLDMMEIPFVPENKLQLNGRDLAIYLRERLPKIAAIAEKLIDTGTPIELTIGGLAFRPSWLTNEKKPDLQVLKEKLESLGIHEEVNAEPTRSYADLVDAEEELTDRVDYDNADRAMRNWEHTVCSCCEDEREERMAELEKRYGRRSLMIPNDYERGVLQGKLEAVKWVLGEEWEDPQERAAGNKVDRLIETAEDLEMIREVLDDHADAEADEPTSTCEHGKDEASPSPRLLQRPVAPEQQTDSPDH